MQLLLLTVLLITAMLIFPWRGVAMGENPKKIKETQESYTSNNFSNGVNEEEAKVIAKDYVVNNKDAVFRNLNHDSAKVFQSGLNDDWHVVTFKVRLKYKLKSGLKWFSIHINKLTGEITVKQWGPS